VVRQKAKVFTNGRSQAVRLPAAFRFDTKEVFIDRNPRSGDVILSRKPANWSEVFAALDHAGVPEDLLADRDRSLPQERELCPGHRSRESRYTKSQTSEGGCASPRISFLPYGTFAR